MSVWIPLPPRSRTSTAGERRSADSMVCRGATPPVERLKTGVCDVMLREEVVCRPATLTLSISTER